MSQGTLPPFISRQLREGRYWFLNRRPRDDKAVVAVCGGYECVAPEYEIARPGFAYQTVEVVTAGFGSAEVADFRFPLAPGVAFGYGPGVPHHITTDPHQPLRKFFICYGGRAAAVGRAARLLATGGPVWLSDLNAVTELFELLQANGNGGTGHSGPICDHLTEVLLRKLDEVGHPAERADRGAADTYHSACRYFRTEYTGLATVEQAAAGLGLSAAYLSRLFRRFGQTTPHRYLTRLKMAHAASVLTASHCLVKEVADQLGFADAFHFSRVFKREFRVSPREFVTRLEGPPSSHGNSFERPTGGTIDPTGGAAIRNTRKRR